PLSEFQTDENPGQKKNSTPDWAVKRARELHLEKNPSPSEFESVYVVINSAPHNRFVRCIFSQTEERGVLTEDNRQALEAKLGEVFEPGKADEALVNAVGFLRKSVEGAVAKANQRDRSGEWFVAGLKFLLIGLLTSIPVLGVICVGRAFRKRTRQKTIA